METRAHHVLIGLFIVILAGAALLLTLFLKRSDAETSYNYYQVVFQETVSGLSKGSAVRYNGIKIGDVTQLNLDPKDPSKVLARIRTESRFPLRQDTQAVLVMTGITGIAAIQLTGGSEQSPILKSQHGEDPIIIANRSALSKLFEGGGDMMSHLNELIVNMRQILSPENRAHIHVALANLETVSTAIVNQSGQTSTLIQELTLASKQAHATLQSTASLVENADKLISKQGTLTLDSAHQAMLSLERTSSQLGQLIKNSEDDLGTGLQSLGDFAPALEELRGTLASIRTVVRQLQDNPSGYLLGQKTIKEFQP